MVDLQLATTDPSTLQRITVLRDHGQARKYFHSLIGWNARMDGIQGAVLRVKLKLLDVANSRRRAHARLYDELLGDTEEIVTPFVAPHRQHVYHIYAVRVKHRDRVLQEMAAKGIGCAIHYPIPVHLQEAYRCLGYGKGSFPVAERCAEQFLSLPMYPELTSDQIRSAAEQLRACVQSRIPQECVT